MWVQVVFAMYWVSHRWTAWTAALSLGLGLGACRSEGSPLDHASDPATPAPSAEGCEYVQEQARGLEGKLPLQLDVDTRITRVATEGCHLTVEYGLDTLFASEVSSAGVRATQTQVAAQLCADRGARAVTQRGGSFTSLYHDRVGTMVSQFTVSESDCVALAAAGQDALRAEL
jgi:hypothetical protein